MSAPPAPPTPAATGVPSNSPTNNDNVEDPADSDSDDCCVHGKQVLEMFGFDPDLLDWKEPETPTFFDEDRVYSYKGQSDAQAPVMGSWSRLPYDKNAIYAKPHTSLFSKPEFEQFRNEAWENLPAHNAKGPGNITVNYGPKFGGKFVSEFMEPGANPEYLTFVVEGAESTESPVDGPTLDAIEDSKKRKVFRLPSLDLESIQPAMKKKAKTNAVGGMANDKNLTLVALASEPAIVPSAEVKKGELKNAVVTNGGYALTQLVSGAPLAPVYSLAPEEYKENRWEGVYAKERRRFVLMAQQLHGAASAASDDEKAEGEAKWQEHFVRLLAAPITHREQIDMVYLRNVSASNPTSLAWVIKIDLELAIVMRRDRSEYRHGKTPQEYVGPSGKPLWFANNAITAIRGVMGYSASSAIYFGADACSRCRVDLDNAASRAALFVKRVEEPTSYRALALPCGQNAGLENGIGGKIVVGPGNCFRCTSHATCGKNTRRRVILS